MGLFGKSEAKDDEGDTPPAVAKKNDDRRLKDDEAPSTICPCAFGNRALDWMKGFIEIKPFNVEPRMAQMRWDHIRSEGALLYRNRHLGCFICKHVDPTGRPTNFGWTTLTSLVSGSMCAWYWYTS